jgi:hypothetical protein
MTELVQPKNTLGFLLSEATGTRSRDKGTLILGQNLAAGTVLGKITASGKYTILAPVAADGSQTAAAILTAATNATAADTTALFLTRDVEINDNELIYPVGITAPQKTTAIANLALVGIIVRA